MRISDWVQTFALPISIANAKPGAVSAAMAISRHHLLLEEIRNMALPFSVFVAMLCKAFLISEFLLGLLVCIDRGIFLVIERCRSLLNVLVTTCQHRNGGQGDKEDLGQDRKSTRLNSSH